MCLRCDFRSYTRPSYHLTAPIEPHLTDGNALFLDSGFTKSSGEPVNRGEVSLALPRFLWYGNASGVK